jgi:hypothetical protein
MYQFVVCPFHNVTQREYRPGEWQAVEAAQQEGGPAVTALSDRRPPRIPAEKVGRALTCTCTCPCVFFYCAYECADACESARARGRRACVGEWAGRVRLL